MTSKVGSIRPSFSKRTRFTNLSLFTRLRTHVLASHIFAHPPTRSFRADVVATPPPPPPPINNPPLPPTLTPLPPVSGAHPLPPPPPIKTYSATLRVHSKTKGHEEVTTLH